MSWLALTVRTESDPATLAGAVREEVLTLDPGVLPERITTLEALYAESAARRRFAAGLLGGFAALALALGIVGVYGVLSYSVARVRIALGARRRSVARAVVARGVALAAAGIAIGVVVAVALSRFLESLVYGIGPRDPTTFLGVPALLLLVAAAAAYLPARRATRVDPVEALRVE